MKNKYIAKIKGRCPNDTEIIDNYKCVIEGKNMIMVEDLKKYLKGFKEVDIYQEDLTKLIARKYRGCKVTLIGKHLGVKIKSCEKYSK